MKNIIYTLSLVLCTLLFMQCGNTENASTGSDSTASSAGAPENTETYYVLAAAGLRMRADASLKGEEIETIKYGEKVQVNTADASDEMTVSGIKGKMAKSYHGDNEGYMFTGYLSSIPVPKIPVKTKGKYATYIENHAKLKKAYIDELTDAGFDAKFEKVKDDEETEVEEHFVIPARNIQEAFLIGQRIAMFDFIGLSFDLPASTNPKTLTAKIEGETVTTELSNPNTVGEATPGDEYFFPFKGHDFTLKKDGRDSCFVTLYYENDKLIGIHVNKPSEAGAWNMVLEAKGDQFVFREIGVAN